MRWSGLFAGVTRKRFYCHLCCGSPTVENLRKCVYSACLGLFSLLARTPDIKYGERNRLTEDNLQSEKTSRLGISRGWQSLGSYYQCDLGLVISCCAAYLLSSQKLQQILCLRVLLQDSDHEQTFFFSLVIVKTMQYKQVFIHIL